MPNSRYHPWTGFLAESALIMGTLTKSTYSVTETLPAPSPTGLRLIRGKTGSELILFQAGSSLSAEAASLLDKMIEAIGLVPSEVSLYGEVQFDKLEEICANLKTGKTVCEALFLGAPEAKNPTSTLIHYSTHPEFLLKNVQLKRGAWEDWKKVAQKLGLTLAAKPSLQTKNSLKPKN